MLPEVKGFGGRGDQSLHDQTQEMTQNHAHLGVDLMSLLCNLPPVGSEHNEIKICINSISVFGVR